MKKLLGFLCVLLLFLGMVQTSNATLYDRGGGLIYCDVLDITLLQDADYAKTSGYNIDGAMTWDEAILWADTLEFGGYDDWRLPSAFNQDGTGPDSGYDVTGSEMGHIFYTELGYSAGEHLSNAGPFIVNPAYYGIYWSGTEYDSDPLWAWTFYLNLSGWHTGRQDICTKELGIAFAWAVRDGDVGAPVPEPSTWLLLCFGMLCLVGLKKKFS